MTLDAYIENLRSTPFSWGENDCLSFVSGALVTQGFEGLKISEYAGLRQAVAQFTQFKKTTGHKSMIDAFDDRFERVVTLHPQDGWIVAREVEGDVLGYAFGIVFKRRMVFVTEHGIAQDYIYHDDCFWRSA